MRTRIDTKTGRARLTPRRNPYFQRHRAGFHIGFRCTAANGVGTWIARRMVGEQYHFKALGDVTEANDFEAAIKLAEAWAAEIDRGVGATLAGRTADVALACAEYVESLRTERPGAAYDAEGRFKRTIHGHAIARLPLDKLREKNLREWRDGLLKAGLSKASANRTLGCLRAALNAAVRSRLTGQQLAFEVRCVEAFEKADGRREVFLDKAQRRALIEATSGALRDLVTAAALTGARPGELIGVRRSAFDARHGNITFTGKTGTRTVPLSPDACRLFERLSRDKLPQALLLTRDDGKPWESHHWAAAVREAVARAGLPAGTVVYSLRHSFITEMLVSGGMSTLSVARLTGTSINMIEKNYGHLVADHVAQQLAAVKML